MNQDMIEMREQIFRDYRKTIEKHKDLDSKYEDLVRQISDIEDERNAVRTEMYGIKDLIDIMITEDCDPVMAKLKHSERISEKSETECASNIMVSHSYGSYGNKNSYPTHTGLTQKSNIVNRLKKAIRW
jgi:hypothetical protein